MISIRYTLCFLTHNNHVLLLHRQKPPNQGLWNGVGGHIETGETPLQSCLRETYEETGIQLKNVYFCGLLTWEGFEISAGGLYLFTASAPTRTTIVCNEGTLAWFDQTWACTSPEVVSNLHIVLPYIFKNSPLSLYHFIYNQNIIQNYSISPLSPKVDITAPWSG
jgi:8-oxo-dGTP diphosphatase